MVKRGYGYRRDDLDGRDHLFKAARHDGLVIPREHNLTAAFPPPMNQGQYGTCTAHAVVAAVRYNLINTGRPDVDLSRSQLYWDAGVAEGNTDDVGRQIRNVIKVAATNGIALDEVWPSSNVGCDPPPEVYADALKHEALEYCRVETDREAINTALFVGHPVIIGIPVFKQFESDEAAATGNVTMPKAFETEVGMHAMLLGAYGAYDTVLNSWGADWGHNGYCYIANGYLEKYGSDFWTILMDN